MSSSAFDESDSDDWTWGPTCRRNQKDIWRIDKQAKTLKWQLKAWLGCKSNSLHELRIAIRKGPWDFEEYTVFVEVQQEVFIWTQCLKHYQSIRGPEISTAMAVPRVWVNTYILV